MFKSLNILNLSSALTSHAAQRHSVIAENIANADTPNYKTRDVQPFEEVFQSAKMEGRSIETVAAKVMISDYGNSMSPNGNSVSLENEMMKSAQAMNEHQLSLQIYKKTLSMMKVAIGKNM